MAITRLSELGGDILRVDAFLDQVAVGGDLIYRMHSQAREVFGREFRLEGTADPAADDPAGIAMYGNANSRRINTRIMAAGYVAIDRRTNISMQ